MALTYYLTIDGVNGGSAREGHVGAFAISDYSFDVGSLASQGAAAFSPLMVDLAHASGLTALLGKLELNPHVNSIELQGVNASNQTLYDLVLNDVTITKYHDSNSGLDSLSFSYGKVSLTTTPVDANGALGTSVTVSWDVAASREAGSLSHPVAAPLAFPDRTNAGFGTTTSADAAHNVLANDIDPVPGDTLHVTAVGYNGQPGAAGSPIAGAFGTLTLNADGSYAYAASSTATLPAGGVGQDVFTYTASTGTGGTADSTLTVIVTAAGFTYLGGAPGTTITSPGGHSFVLDGGAGNETLVATNGATVLIGGPGDTLTGGKGADTYVFTGLFGQNTITNYHANKDIIDLAHSQLTTLGAVHDATHQVGANTVITVGTAGTITLTGVSLSQLHFDASHFLLV